MQAQSLSVVRDVHVHGRRRRLAHVPALQTLELIHGPVHVALDAGLVALDAFELRAIRDAETLESDLAREFFPPTELPAQAVEVFPTDLKMLALFSDFIPLVGRMFSIDFGTGLPTSSRRNNLSSRPGL